jgi:alkylhydroperoxidase family enzyme
MRLPYTSNPPTFNDVEEKAILDRILARRGPSGLLAIDQTLLHAPLLANGFNSFFKALRTENTLPPDCREIAFCTVSAISECWYEWDIHAPIASENGVTKLGLNSIRSLTSNQHETLASDQDGLTNKQAAVVRYAAAMTSQTRVDDVVFTKVAKHFTPKEMIELTLSIAGFNCVTKFVCALDVGEKNHVSRQ